ncbi:MAG: lipid-transfer protein [Acidimicrobiales bacterium mtb01]|nr:lipid-transfer protein [Actinomycetota bacterium]TEX45692.1 MAG: lipid-transfer protein [Acidimicrobiales bacterium mtb01]
MSKVFVVGVGMTRFEKPGAREWDYPDMVHEAASLALADALLTYSDVERAVAGFVYGETVSGQCALYTLGRTGIPIFNVNNACSSGSSALLLAHTFVSSGQADCVLAVGFEKMERGSLQQKYPNQASPIEPHLRAMAAQRGWGQAPPAAQLFGNAGVEHMERFGTTREQFAMVAEKNHRHSVNNPYAQFTDAYSLEEILGAPMVFDPLTKLQCCPTSEGAAAAVVCSQRFVERHGLHRTAVEMAGIAMATDTDETFTSGSCIRVVGAELTRSAGLKAYEQSGLGPEDLDVIELHDCFSTNEIITYEALGLCAEGQGGELVASGATTYGGTWVVNPSGGLLSKGHPLGATGIAQCAEIAWQLRGLAGARQADRSRAAMQHNIGLGGAAIVSIYRAVDQP